MDPATIAMIMSAISAGKGALGGIFSGLFGDAGEPYEAAKDVLGDFYNKGEKYQNPFYQGGVSALPQFKEWLGGMKNPSDFINNLMGKYQESPWAKFQQQQSIRSGQNMGSASGLTGSTPLAQFMQQNARDISSQDMQNWLSKVLGINTEYGAGLGGQVGMGQNAANSLTNMTTDFGKSIAEQEYNRKAAEQNQRRNLWGGLFNLI